MPSLHTPWWHGSGTQSLMFSSQSRPVNPEGGHFIFRTITKIIASTSGASVVITQQQCRHVYGYSLLPSAHSQSYPLGRSIHLAPFKQGVLEHSSMSIWHISPLKPENRMRRSIVLKSGNLDGNQKEKSHSFLYTDLPGTRRQSG